MKSDWTIRWWDVMALILALGAATLAFRLAVVKGSIPSGPVQQVEMDVRVFQPLPEVVDTIAPQDALVNRLGEKVGTVIAVQWLDTTASAVPSEMPAGKRDVLLTIKVSGKIPVVRNVSGFSREPSEIKVGAWCLVTTEKAEVSGMIVGVRE